MTIPGGSGGTGKPSAKNTLSVIEVEIYEKP